MEELLVIKIGGNIIDNETALSNFLIDFASLNGAKILAHGGGKLATELSSKLGIETKLADGRRITDDATIKVVTMTYAGWINKSIVAKLQSLNCNAIGLTGADANILPAVTRPVKDIDYGWVGDIVGEKINAGFLNSLLTDSVIPVIAPIAANSNGQLLNINADTVARALAEGLSHFYNVKLIYCFEKNGLLKDVNDESSVIHKLNRAEADELKSDGTISKGMLPKIDNAFGAIANGVSSVIIGHAAEIKKLAQNEKGYGTSIQA